MWRINSKQYAVNSKEKKIHTPYCLLPTNNKGFTLVELLVTASILGMLALAISTTFASGLKVYDRVQTYSGVQADILISLEKMEKDLKNTLRFSGIDFAGDAKKVTFAGLTAYPDTLTPDTLTENLGKFSYYFDPETGSLVKEEQGLTQAESKFKVLAFIKGINFRYYYFNSETQKFDWKDSWAEGEGIPRGVKLEVIFKDGNRDVKLVRTLLIPVSS